MEIAIESPVVPHPMFAQAESAEHFVQLLGAYHEELISGRPPELRYELKISPMQFEGHAADDPDYKSDLAWGEYSFTLVVQGARRQEKSFANIHRDYPFLQILSSQGTGGTTATQFEELHGVTQDVECFPKLHAEFMALQDLTASHKKHVDDLNKQARESCEGNVELQNIKSTIINHRLAIYQLEASEKALRDQIAAELTAANPEPRAAERAALLQKFQTH